MTDDDIMTSCSQAMVSVKNRRLFGIGPRSRICFLIYVYLVSTVATVTCTKFHHAKGLKKGKFSNTSNQTKITPQLEPALVEPVVPVVDQGPLRPKKVVVHPKKCMLNGNYQRNKTKTLYQHDLQATQPLPMRNQDPRLSGKCRLFFDNHAKNRSVVSSHISDNDNRVFSSPIITVEDMIANNLKAPSPRHKGSCTKLQHLGSQSYGPFLFPSHIDGGDAILYVEVPKVASTTVKYWMQDLFCFNEKFVDVRQKNGLVIGPIFSPNQLSFVIVREPLKRFLSGYQTVRIRALLKAEDGEISRSKENEIKRFENYVEKLVSRGALIGENNQRGSFAWCHTLSQMWFIEMYPQQINFVLHLESLEQDLEELGKRLPIVLPNTPLVAENTGEKRKSQGELSPQVLMDSSPHSIKLIIDYSKHDYICLGYPIPKF